MALLGTKRQHICIVSVVILLAALQYYFDAAASARIFVDVHHQAEAHDSPESPSEGSSGSAVELEELGAKGQGWPEWKKLEVSEEEMLRRTSIYSLRDLQCPRQPSQIRPEDVANGTRLAAFANKLGNDHQRRGSTRMRGEMMASAVSMVPGWKAVVVYESRPSRLPPSVKVDMCVLVKTVEPMLRWCLTHQARVIYLDIIDNSQQVYDTLMGRSMILGVDVALAPSNALQEIANSSNPPYDVGVLAGLPRGQTWYHQHSNPGYRSPVRRAMVPFVCRAAVFLSSKTHGPRGGRIQRMRRQACQSPSLWAFAVLDVSDGGATLEDFPCGDGSDEMKRACEEADEQTRAVELVEVPRSGCYPSQWGYHGLKNMSFIDVIIIMPETHTSAAQHRPSTRFLHWASHGIPAVFWTFHSYVDLAQEAEYYLPSGRIPAVEWDLKDLATVLSELASAASRLTLRDKGLRLAAKYSPLGVAKQLTDLHEQIYAVGPDTESDKERKARYHPRPGIYANRQQQRAAERAAQSRQGAAT